MNLLPFRGDSSALVDRASLSTQIVDTEGHLVRTMAIPARPSDAAFVANKYAGKASFDGDGNLVYRSPPRLSRDRVTGVMTADDSTALVRVRARGRTDTITFVHIPVPKATIRPDSTGKLLPIAQVNPLPLVDDFAVLADGSIGVFRGRDFRLDLFTDGRRTGTFKVPHVWQRLNDEVKAALVDSAEGQRKRSVARVIEKAKREGRPIPPFEDLIFVAPSELPDYFPAFELNAVLRDLQDRFWVKVLPTTVTPNNTFYVINRIGRIERKVGLNKAYELIAFGPDSSAYLMRTLTPVEEPSLLSVSEVRGSNRSVLVRAVLH